MKNIKKNKFSKDIKINQYNKRHFTLEEMIYVLEQRGLIVEKPEILNDINYSYLIYNFSQPFYYAKLKYTFGTKLSDIYNFYLFSKKASIALFSLIYDIEHKFKKIIASLISEKSVYSYLEKKSYNFNKDDSSFKNFFKRIKNNHKLFLVTKKEELNEKLKNNVIPIWIFINKLSLGDLIKMVKYNKKFITSNPYKKMQINEKQMLIINRFRDEIAHMNPIEEKIKFKIENGMGSAKYKDFLKTLNILVPNLKIKLEKFWNKNQDLLKDSIKKEIKEKFFSLD